MAEGKGMKRLRGEGSVLQLPIDIDMLQHHNMLGK